MNNVLFPDEITGEMLLNQNINEIPTLLGQCQSLLD